MNMNSVVTYSIAGELNAAMLACLVEKPPVEIVDMEWQRESNHPIPATCMNKVHIKVSPMYIVNSQRAVTEIRGCSLARIGPADSAAKR